MKSQRQQIDSDQHFQQFAVSLERAIAKYETISEETLLQRQKKQVETLIKLEKKFRRTLCNHRWGAGVYRSFIDMIVNDKKNILAARPYFRERQQVFTQSISKAIKGQKFGALKKFHFNFTFVKWVLGARKWAPKSPIVQIADQIAKIRCELIEMNMPLAISRARIFWSRTPKSQLSYMDLVQISCEGLMSAVDKFVLPYSPVFRAVAIGRISGNFIENYSETLVHFYPSDKRKIYRAHKLLGKLKGDDYQELADKVNIDIAPGHQTTPSEIADLVAAASTVSADVPCPHGSGTDASEEFQINTYAADESVRPDVIVERVDSQRAMYAAMEKLSVFEQKLLQLKGIVL